LREWRADRQLPPMLLQHGGWGMIDRPDLLPVGKWTEFAEDDKGLLSLASWPRHRSRQAKPTAAQDDRRALERNVDRLPRQEVHASAQSRRRAATHLDEVDLIEVSLVTFPANPKARIGSSVKSNRQAFRYETGARSRPSCVTKGFSRTRP
jgi:hypothetical protein